MISDTDLLPDNSLPLSSDTAPVCDSGTVLFSGIACLISGLIVTPDIAHWLPRTLLRSGCEEWLLVTALFAENVLSYLLACFFGILVAWGTNRESKTTVLDVFPLRRVSKHDARTGFLFGLFWSCVFIAVLYSISLPRSLVLISAHRKAALLASVLLLILPFVEELFLRGYLQNFFRPYLRSRWIILGVGCWPAMVLLPDNQATDLYWIGGPLTLILVLRSVGLSWLREYRISTTGCLIGNLTGNVVLALSILIVYSRV